MKKIQYEIKFLSEWHIGSGLGAGAASDAVVLVDKNQMPFVPGKTIKGLLRDAMCEINEVQQEKISKDDILRIFGQEKELKENEELKNGNAHFSNATIEKDEYNVIVQKKLQEYIVKNIASTAINEYGVAEEKSLRSREVCIPMTLFGSIDIEAADEVKVKMALQWVRAMGVNRNRGLGRCKITITN